MKAEELIRIVAIYLPSLIFCDISLGQNKVAANADSIFIFKIMAKGVQIYECKEKDVDGNYSIFIWEFSGPKADLFDENESKIGSHYKDKNGPAWEHLKDGSKVVGVVVEKADAPVKDAVPWLILNGTEHFGNGIFSRAFKIHRVETHGGKAPSTPLKVADLGKSLSVPYTALYYFYNSSCVI